MMPDWLIGGRPQAVCAVVLGDDGSAYGVSRKQDHTKFGFGGGKVDPGELPEEALVRELKEEMGIDVAWMQRILTDVCNGEVAYVTHCYLIGYRGEPTTQPGEGIVAKVMAKDLLEGPFGEYNQLVIKKLAELGVVLL